MRGRDPVSGRVRGSSSALQAGELRLAVHTSCRALQPTPKQPKADAVSSMYTHRSTLRAAEGATEHHAEALSMEVAREDTPAVKQSIDTPADTCRHRHRHTCRHSIARKTMRVLQARTLFAAEAATEVWQYLQKPLRQSLTQAPLRALILLLTFFPHKAASTSPELPWADFATQAVEIWLSSKLNPFWDRLWLCFLSRLAKWDTHVRTCSRSCHGALRTCGGSHRAALCIHAPPSPTAPCCRHSARRMQGRIDWPALLRPVCAYCMHVLRVPIGGARGPAPSATMPSDLAFTAIADRVCNSERGALEHLGKLLVYSVRPGAHPSAPFPALAPLDAIRSFAALLEHFYHAPNSGKCAAQPTHACTPGSP
jgi:hypothetical protein